MSKSLYKQMRALLSSIDVQVHDTLFQDNRLKHYVWCVPHYHSLDFFQSLTTQWGRDNV